MDQDEKIALAQYQHAFLNKTDSQKSAPPSFVRGGIIDPNKQNKESMIENKEKGMMYSHTSKNQNEEQVTSPTIKSSSNKPLGDQKRMIDVFREQLKEQASKKLQLQVIPPARKQVPEQKRKPKTEIQQAQLVCENLKKSIPHIFTEINEINDIVIYGLTQDQDEQVIYNHFEQFGQITYVDRKAIYLNNDLETQANIIGYISFQQKEEAQSAFYSPDILKKLGENIKLSQEVRQILVELPQNPLIRKFIDKFARLVQSDGYLVEQYTKEVHYKNPLYAFLFVQNCAEHIYYKWRLYSFLQGDNEKHWQSNLYQMTVGGPFWIPPSSELQEQELSVADQIDKEKETALKKQQVGTAPLSDQDREELEDQLRNITTNRMAIGELMVFCMDRYMSSCDIVMTITNSIYSAISNITLLIARLYLISDLLHNCSMTSPNFWSFRIYFQKDLPTIMEQVNKAYSIQQQKSGFKAESLKEKVQKVLQVWSEMSVFDQNYMSGLESIIQANRKKFIKQNNQIIYKYDIQTDIGVKLKAFENQLLIEDFDTLERKAQNNGLSSQGDKDELIARLIMLEEYKQNKIDINLKKDLVFDFDIDEDRKKAVTLVEKLNKVLYKSQPESADTIDSYIQDGLKLLKFLEQRNTILEDCKHIDGQKLDELDAELYDIPLSGEYTTNQKVSSFTIGAVNVIDSEQQGSIDNSVNDQKDLDGEELTLEEILKIQRGEFNVVCFHQIDYLYKNIDPTLLCNDAVQPPEPSKQSSTFIKVTEESIQQQQKNMRYRDYQSVSKQKSKSRSRSRSRSKKSKKQKQKENSRERSKKYKRKSSSYSRSSSSRSPSSSDSYDNRHNKKYSSKRR